MLKYIGMNKRTKERINKKIIQKNLIFPQKKKRADNKNLNENHDLMCLSRLNCLLYYFVRNVFAKGDEAGPEKMRNSSFGRKKTSLLLALHLFRLLLLWRCLEFTIAPKFSLAPLSKRFRCWINLSKPKLCLPVMLFIILYILAHPVLLFFFFRTTKEFPKSWREFKFEILTIFCGLRSQNEDLFLKRRNRISWVTKINTRSCSIVSFVSELIQLPNKVAVITGGNRGIGIHVVEKLLKCGMTVAMGENESH